MPIEGKFCESDELQEILGVSKQAIRNIAYRQGWGALKRGLFCAESVEPYLFGKGICPETLPVRTYDHSDGVTWDVGESG